MLSLLLSFVFADWRREADWTPGLTLIQSADVPAPLAADAEVLGKSAVGAGGWNLRASHSRVFFLRRKELVTTETELNAMAADAIMGFKSRYLPMTGTSASWRAGRARPSG